MKFILDDKEYRVCWTHYNNYKQKSEPSYTKCQIKCELNHIAAGWAYCSKLDQYNKKIGRKISFKRAIRCFTRQQRREIWKQWHVKFSKIERNHK